MDRADWVKPIYNEYGITQWGWRVNHRENLKMSDDVWIGSFTVIDATDGVEIEDDVIIGYGCVITSISRIEKKHGKVTLKKGCKIGAQAVIVPGVTVGENAIVGGSSYVNTDIPKGEVWYGTPAKFASDVADIGTEHTMYENPPIPF